jgi:glycosyltransferase involved in cell wall biosynthesis
MSKTIYFLIPDLEAGGAERVTITIARLMHREGYAVQFVNLGGSEGEMLSWIRPEFKMTSFNFPHVLRAIPRLRAFMKAHPDGIYFSSREHVNIVGIIAATLAHRPIVVRIPNMPRNVLTRGVRQLKAQVIKALNRQLLRRAKVVIAQNKEMRRQLLECYGLAETKVVAINNPVDKDFVRASAKDSANPFSSNEVNFLAACTVDYRKGIDTLIEAWPKVKAEIPNAHMYVAGRNTCDFAVEMMKRAENLPDFTFLGFQENPYPLLKHCDVFTLPSRMEGLPNVVLEAMCFNRPIAATTCVEVIKDIITPGKNGYYCDIENADALARCMIQAYQLKDINNDYNLFDKDALINVFN